MKEFKSVLGNRIYLEVPKLKTKVILTPSTEEGLKKEYMQKNGKLTVYAVGAGVMNKELQEGVQVMVDPRQIQNSVSFPLNDDLEIIVISEYDILHIW